MIFSENRYPLFRIMPWSFVARTLSSAHNGDNLPRQRRKRPREAPHEDLDRPHPHHPYRQPAAAEGADRPHSRSRERRCRRRRRVRGRDRQSGRRRRCAAGRLRRRRGLGRRDEEAVLHDLYPPPRRRHRARPARRRKGPRHHDRPRSPRSSGFRPRPPQFRRHAVSRLRRRAALQGPLGARPRHRASQSRGGASRSRPKCS